MSKVISYLKGKEMQKCYIVLGVMFLFLSLFAINPFATDGYEDIGSRKALDKRVATAISNHQSELYIDYNGEDYANMKTWFKDDFKYDNLIKYTDEFAIYNYDGAKYTYWSYGDKKRVKVNISYKLTNDQIAFVDNFTNDYIEKHNLKKMSKYNAIKNVHDYLVNNYTYVTSANNLYNVIKNKKANCYGYTMLNYVILNKLDIPIRTTYGAMNEAHIWNAVKLNGQWYYEDVTWDTVNKGTDYFLISTNKIKKNHTIYGNFIPNCPSNYVPKKKDDTLIDKDINNVGSSSVEDNQTNSSIEDEVKQDEIKDNTSKNEDTSNIEDTSKNNSNSTIENTEIESPSNNIPNNSNTNTDNSNSSNQKENKTQKLMKLLKILKNLFKK